MTKDIYKDKTIVADIVDRFVAVKTDEFTDEDRANVVAELSAQYGKPEASIIGKLVREGVYRAKTRTTKTGAPIVKKGTLVDCIASALPASISFTEPEATSLENANKAVLNKIFTGIDMLQKEIDAFDETLDEVPVEVVEVEAA